MRRPTIFIGSSSESLPVATAVQAAVDDFAESTVWTQGVFDPGTPYIQALADKANHFDFALLIMATDDVVESRGTRGGAPRDNVIFELGLFIGALGRSRTFFMYNRDHPLRIPTDLSGVSSLSFRDRSDGNIHAAVAPACARLQEVVERLGPREDSRAELTLRFVGRGPEDLSEDVRRKLQDMLSQLMKDPSTVITGVSKGSIKVQLEASSEAANLLLKLFKSGHLNELLGMKILEVAVGPEAMPDETLASAVGKAHHAGAAYDVFLSHAGSDRVAATELYDALSNHCRVWLDTKSLRPGDDWDRTIADAQQASRSTVVLISSGTDGTFYQREEVARAIAMARRGGAQQHRVIPVYIGDEELQLSSTPYGLAATQGIRWDKGRNAWHVAEMILSAIGSG